MPDGFYIPRTIEFEGRHLTEAELLKNESIIIVLAEPGAGKTDLLNSLAAQLNVRSQRASIFKNRSSPVSADNLVLDALDEVAKIDLSAIIVPAREAMTRRLILASRSSEWEDARSIFIKECFGKKPLTVKLLPLDDSQQKAIFENHLPSESFDSFKHQTETRQCYFFHRGVACYAGYAKQLKVIHIFAKEILAEHSMLLASFPKN